MLFARKELASKIKKDNKKTVEKFSTVFLLYFIKLC